MINSELKPQNLPEKLIWYYIICTYPIYYLGGQYILAPLLGYFLVFYLCRQWWYQTPATPQEEKIIIPTAIWLWIIGMLMIEIALIIGHFNFDLGLGKTISSSINRWLRTWALLPIFMLVGCLKIRPQLIYRAVCILCVQSLFVTIIASILQIHSLYYVSPLKIFGGGLSFYEVSVFGIVLSDVGELRLRLFAPWAPALALVANIYFFLVREEQNSTWKWLGMIGAVAMIVGSVSRLGIICLPFTICLSWWLMNIYRPLIQLTTGLIAFLGGFLGPTIFNTLQLAREQISKSRPGSSRVRAILRRTALYRWQSEAFFWGHGTVGEQGPKVTGFMQIGTHHTWFSILYNHGLIGCLSLAIPLAWSLVELIFKAQNSPTAKVALNVILVLTIFTVGENLDSLTYLYWPGLIILGISLREHINPLALDKKQLTI